jgi:hypothetical protein
MFHIRWISILKFLYLIFFLAFYIIIIIIIIIIISKLLPYLSTIP